MEQLTFKLDQFEGPLDLLLFLISKHKLNIYDIEIAKLLEQYMAYIDEAQFQNMEVASEFLEMASRLVYLKTVSLLPRHEEEEDKLKQELTGQLLEYQACKQVAALLAAQNVVVAAESMGLGTVYLGSILADPRPVVKVLQLPELTFPVLGLLVGHPDQEPGQKPRMPLSVMTARNTYPRVESYSETLADYDREVTEYYDLRSGSRLESFSHLVATNIGVGGAHVSPIMEVLHEQGLCLR